MSQLYKKARLKDGSLAAKALKKVEINRPEISGTLEAIEKAETRKRKKTIPMCVCERRGCSIGPFHMIEVEEGE